MSGRRAVLMARRLKGGLMSAGGTMIACSRGGGQALFVLLEDEAGAIESVRSCFETVGVEDVKSVKASEGSKKEVQALLREFMPDVAFLPSPVEDREAFVMFSSFMGDNLEKRFPGTILAYELHVPLLPDLIVDITPEQQLKERFMGSGVEVDLSQALNHYRSVTNMRGRGFAEAFVSVTPETLVQTAQEGAVPTGRLDAGPIRFFSGFERLARGGSKWWDGSGERKRMIVLSPHFDDETIGCGGTIYRHVHRGDRVAVLFMTDGSEGDPREDDSDLVSSVRKREAIDAMEILGVERMEFLDRPETMLMPGVELEKRVCEIVNAFGPDVICLPSFLENHIDHVELNRIFYRVARKMDSDPEIRLYGLWTLIPPNFLVDIGDDFEKKVQAINKYRSQITQVDYLSVTIALNRYWSINYGDGKGYLETFCSVGREEYCSMIESLGVDREVVYGC